MMLSRPKVAWFLGFLVLILLYKTAWISTGLLVVLSAVWTLGCIGADFGALGIETEIRREGWSMLDKMEVLTAISQKDWQQVRSHDGGEIWKGDMNAHCSVMKTLFPEQHPITEKIDDEWAHRVLAKADPELVKFLKSYSR